jgi:putative ABC transport system permease protein
MNLRTCTVRRIQRRPGRMLLTLLGITLGLATVVATRLTTHTVSSAYHELFDGVTGTSLEVTAPGRSAFSTEWTGRITSIRGVKEVAPSIRGAARVVGLPDGATTPIVGVPRGKGGEQGRLLEGHLLTKDEEALADQVLAERLRVGPGQTIRVMTAAGLTPLRLAGIVTPQSSIGSSGLLVVSLAKARLLFRLHDDQVNCLGVRLDDQAGGQRIQSLVAARLPKGLTVAAPGGHGSLAQSTLTAAEQGLAALGVMAVITSTFVIFNTFLLELADRRRQLALLKTLGASRRQVLRLLLGEALMLGAVGAAAGCTLGTGLALLLLALMERFLAVKLPPLHFTPGPYLLAGLLGPSTTVATACLPAWKASCRPPLDWLLPQRADSEISCGVVGVSGLVLLLLGGCPAIGLGRGWFPPAVSRPLLPVTIALLLAGGALTFPLLLRPMLRMMRRLPMGLVSGLSLESLARNQIRTGLTAGVLFLALTVTVGFGHSLRGLLRDLHDWYDQTVVADYLVRASMPDTSFSLVAAVPATLPGELAALDGVAIVEKLAFISVEANGQNALVLARTFSPDAAIPMDLREGNARQVRQGLKNGQAVLGTGLAEQLGVHRGDKVTLKTARGPVAVGVAGAATEYAVGGAALYLEWGTAGKLLGVPGAHVLLVTARPGRSQALGETLKKFCAERHLILQSNREARDQLDELLQRVTGAIWALLLLIFVVASLGIVNTLQMNIQEQMRTFAILRSMGMKSGQVLRLVLGQALFLGLLTLLPGAVAGVGLAWLISRGSSSLAGAPMTFRLDEVVVAGACSIAVASALLAALPPARRAVRMPVLDALG